MVQKSIATKKTSNRLMTALQVVYYVLQSLLLMFVPKAFLKRKDVKNQIILITGGGSGIGQLMVLKFLKLGSKVIVWDINEDGLKTTEKMAEEENLNVKDLYTFKVDISDSEAIYKLAEKVKQEIGPVDILINNAGVVSGDNFLDIPDSRIELTFKVNVLSHFYIIKAFLPEMIKRKKGHIVTIASCAGHIGVCSLADYCASKYANVGMDFSLRMELAKADLDQVIKTTIVKPYFITTGMFSGVDTGVFSFLQPEYVADSIVDEILLETPEVFIPGYFRFLLAMTNILPLKCVLPVYDFIGGFEFMDNFHGRQLPNNTNQKGTEINNNHNNNNNNIINNNNNSSSQTKVAS